LLREVNSINEKEPSGSLPLQVIIAAFNEEEGIGLTIAELRRVLGDALCLVVDGNSTDNTAVVAREFGAVVLFQKGKGKGDAIGDAIVSIHDTEQVVIIDADYTYPAKYLPGMIRILQENSDVGMVCGDRFSDDLDLGDKHGALYFGNRVLAFIHGLMNGVQMHDPLTGLRVIRWAAIKDWRPKSKSFDIEVELNRQIEKEGYRIVEVPIDYRPRVGEKKLQVKDGFTILRRILVP